MAYALPHVPAKTLDPTVKNLNPNTTTPLSYFPYNTRTLLLEQCKTIKHLNQIHAHIIKTGLLLNPTIIENLLESSAIALPASMPYAVAIFDGLDRPHAAAFNIMIRGFTLNRSLEKAILLYKQMVVDSVEPDKYTFPCILKACSRLQALNEGEQIHAHIMKLGFASQGFVQNTLIHMYASCGNVGVARRMFDEIPERGIVTWNSMFAGYTKAGDWDEVVRLFYEMLDSGDVFHEVTMICVLTACGRLGNLELGERLSGYIEANGLTGSLNLITALMDMYAKCGRVDTARELFDGLSERDVVAWSAMISGYNQANRCREALALFHDMQMANVEPNEITMVSVLSACAILGALETGKWVHFFIKRKRMKLTVTLGTALMDFYAKCGCVENSFEVFEKMPQKNVLSWTVLIQSLASNGQGREALNLFSTMQEANIKPNDVTFIGVLAACSHTGLVEDGWRFFETMIRDYGIKPRIEHYGCMVDILGRAGLIDEAHKFIKDMPIEPNAVVWRTLLSSCKVHRNVEMGEESLKQIVRLEPNHSGDYILLSNIYASVGRFEDALKVRTQMKEKGIKKTPGCSIIEIDGVIHEFFAEDSSHPQSKDIYDTIEDMVKRLKLAGYVPNTEEARIDAEEDEKEISVSHHSEKLAIAFGLIRTLPGATIRISKNLRVCTDCHTATKLISKVFEREIVVRDRNRFHHFKGGYCSCNDYW